VSFTLNPSQNFDHLLHPVSGYNGMHDLQFVGQPADGADWRRGALVSLDAAGKLVAGLSTAVAMPMWTNNDSSDYDAASDKGNISGGNVAAFPATAGLELKTTEVDLDNFTASDFTVNKPLVAAESLNGGTEGLIAPGVLGTGDKIPLGTSQVGVISKGVFADESYAQDVLRFWPCYNPGRV